MDEEKTPFRIVSRKETEIGRFKIIQEELLIDGHTYPYSFSEMKDSVCILPICEDKIVLISEYRQSLGRRLVEFPAGAVEEGERPLDAAVRELVEETGYEAVEMLELGCYPISPGTSSMMVHLFAADCKKSIGQMLDKTEDIAVTKVEQSEFDRMIEEGEFGFLIGIAMWELYKRKGKR